MCSTTISIYLRKKNNLYFIARLKGLFPKSRIASKGVWFEIAVWENNSEERIKLIRKIVRKLKNENFKFPKGSVLLVASFFDSAMSSLSLSPRDVATLSLLNLGVEFVVYPCSEPNDDDVL